MRFSALVLVFAAPLAISTLSITRGADADKNGPSVNDNVNAKQAATKFKRDIDAANAEFERKLKILRQEYETKEALAQKAYKTSLNAAMAEETRKGHLDVALAIKEAINQLPANLKWPEDVLPAFPAPVVASNNSVLLTFVDDGKQIVPARGSAILPIAWADSKFTLGKSADGSPAMISAGAFAQFVLSKPLREALKGHACTINVRSSVNCALEYDAEAAAYLKCEDRTASKDGDVATTQFKIPKASFAGRQNGGGDFRFILTPGAKLFSVEIVRE